MDAKQAGTDAHTTANAAKSSADSANTAITAIAIILGFVSVGLLLTAAGAGAGYVSLSASVAILSAIVTGYIISNWSSFRTDVTLHLCSAGGCYLLCNM